VSVTAAQGFVATGLEIGLKHSGGKDLALVQNVGPHKAAAVVFTSNRAKANPILWSQQVIADGVVEAIILNSGGANCYTAGIPGHARNRGGVRRQAGRLSRRHPRLLDRAYR
jgi:glutamate N-acetyltransferase/amino-acid N-acetyltransferase